MIWSETTMQIENNASEEIFHQDGSKFLVSTIFLFLQNAISTSTQRSYRSDSKPLGHSSSYITSLIYIEI